MKHLSVFVGFLGLLACSDATGQAEEAPKITPQATAVEKAEISPVITANWAVYKAKSTLSFSGNQSGEAFTGKFENFDAVINFNPDDLATAKVVVTIDTNSADANDAERTDALPSKEWFYVKKFPVAMFKASELKHVQADKYEAKGNLTIRDITQEIVLPFNLKIEDGHATMDATFTLNRTAYKVGTGMWASEDWVGHDVAVNVHIEAAAK